MAEHLAASAYPWLVQNWRDLVHRHQVVGLPHALMLTGASGLGKHALSSQVAEWLLCQLAITSGQTEPCGECHSCRLWVAGSHPDIVVCEPEEGSRQIRIDDVRKINDFVHQTPQISACQVVILRPAEVLNINAANALLKTLEEPTGESFILLESERFGSVLPTIRSRCQRVDIKSPPRQESLAWLAYKGYTEDTAIQALSASSFAPVAALEWLQSDQAGQRAQWSAQLIKWCTGQISLPDLMSSWKGVEPEILLQWLLSLSVDLARAQQGVTASSEPEAVSFLVGHRQLNQEHLFSLYDKIQENLIRLRSGASSINTTLLLESLMVDWRGLYH